MIEKRNAMEAIEDKTTPEYNTAKAEYEAAEQAYKNTRADLNAANRAENAAKGGNKIRFTLKQGTRYGIKEAPEHHWLTVAAAQIKWILQNVSGNKICFNNYEEFNNFAKEMSNYFDIHNLRLITAVPGRELRNFENIARQANNYNDYYVCSYLGSSVKKKAETQNLYRVYWPALFAYPDDKTSLGLNYSSLSHLRIAIDAVLKTGQIHAVPASRRRFQGQLMILGPSQYDDNGNINSMFVAFLAYNDRLS